MLLDAGSDMRALVQEACQGPVRDAVAAHAEKLATLSEADLRPLNIRDFQVGWVQCPCAAHMMLTASRCRPSHAAEHDLMPVHSFWCQNI